MKRGVLAFSFVLAILALSLVSADVGVGVSPSKMIEQIQAGQSEEVELLIFNTGDASLDISLSFTGDIAKFAEVVTTSQIIEPEPKPHALPIKNGKTFLVKLSVPGGTKAGTYSGLISATGGAVEGSTFGGNVGVSTKIDIQVIEPESFFAKISTTSYIIIGAIILLILLIWFLKKQGLNISFKKNKK